MTELTATDATDTTMGEIAYNAYREHTGGKSLVSGEGMPFWQSLPDDIRAAWEAAGKAVAPKWRPIEEGRHDKYTPILGGCLGTKWRQVLWWQETGESGWCNASGRAYYPTHYQPLPEPPE